MQNSPGPRVSSWIRPNTFAHAHTGTQTYLWIDITRSGLSGAVEYPARSLATVLDIGAEDDGEMTPDTIRDNSNPIIEYTRRHLSIRHDGRDLLLGFETPSSFGHQGGGYVRIGYTAPDLRARPTDTLMIEFDGIVESQPEHDGLFIVRSGSGLGQYQRYSSRHIPFRRSSTSHSVDLSDPGWLEHLGGASYDIARRVWRRIRR